MPTARQEASGSRQATATRLWVALALLASVLGHSSGDRQRGPILLGDAEGLTRLIINIGSYHNPPKPWTSAEHRTGVLAIEARTDAAIKIEQLKDRWVLTAAVASHFGVAPFWHHEDSSSLLQPSTNLTHWNQIKDKGLKGSKVLVPTVPLSYIIEHVSVPIWCDCLASQWIR